MKFFKCKCECKCKKEYKFGRIYLNPKFFPDKNFLLLVKSTLGANYDTDITDKVLDVKKIGSFANGIIYNIEGIQYFENLEKVDLKSHYISDLKPLCNLKKIKYLNISCNNITDITHLKELKNIEYLNLSHNYIQDISALSYLKKVERLDLSNNEISNMSSIYYLNKLVWLSLDNNQLYGTDGINGAKNLQFLYLSNNKIILPSFLNEDFKNLHTLFIDGNPVENLNYILSIPNLKYLRLEKDKLADIDELRKDMRRHMERRWSEKGLMYCCHCNCKCHCHCHCNCK